MSSPGSSTSAAHKQNVPSAFVTYLPGLAFGSAALFLAGGTYLGIRIGLQRGAKEAAAATAAAPAGHVGVAPTHVHALAAGEPVNIRAAYNARLPNANGMSAGQLAGKALLYGTALCLGSSAIAGLGIAWYLDTWTLDSFSRKMEKLLPKARTSLQGALESPLDALSSSSSTLGGKMKSSMPRVRGGSKEEEEAGLPLRDRRMLDEFRALFEEVDKNNSNEEGKAGGRAKGTTATQ